MRPYEEHKFYTTASLKEAFLFLDHVTNTPGYSNIQFSNREGQDSWDVIYNYTASTKPYLCEIKLRSGNSNWQSYYLEEDKYAELIKSAATYNLVYANFFSEDQQLLMWEIEPQNNYQFRMAYTQHNNRFNEPKLKSVTDMPTTKAKRYKADVSFLEAETKAEQEYKARLSPQHKKQWKTIKNLKSY